MTTTQDTPTRHNAPRKQRHVLRWVLLSVLALVVFIVVLAATTGSKKPATTPRATTHTSAPATQAPATQAPATKAPAATQAPATQVPQATAVATWMAGQGGQNMIAVEGDLSQTATDAGNQDLTAVENDGAQLATDAGAASSTPPPLSASVQSLYKQAMADYSTAGTDMANGDITGAETVMQAGTADLNQATAQLP
jgi:hypothetical protein